MADGEETVAQGMRDYYDRRAGEYDDWWLGTGQFAHRHRPWWDEEVGTLLRLVEALPPARTLDVGCGTGFLTAHLPGEITAIDQSANMVETTRTRLPGAAVLQADATAMPFEDGVFERVFTSHLYGHLFPEEREAFVREAKRVGGELVIVDSALHLGVEGEEYQERMLGDASLHTVYKRYFAGPSLVRELGGARVLHDGHWFIVVRSAA